MELLVKRDRYYIVDMIATRISKKKFKELQKVNDVLEGFEFAERDEIDCTWWTRCYKYLTPKTLYMDQVFHVDNFGKVTRY